MSISSERFAQDAGGLGNGHGGAVVQEWHPRVGQAVVPAARPARLPVAGDPDSEVVLARVCAVRPMHGGGLTRDQVQLAVAEPEPGARHRDWGALDLLKPDDLAVEPSGPLQVGHRQADVVEDLDVHSSLPSKPRRRLAAR